MKRTIMLIPIDNYVGLTSISLGLIKKMQENKRKICFFKPISTFSNDYKCYNDTTNLIHQKTCIDCIDSIQLNDTYFFRNYEDISSLIDKVVEKYYLYKDNYEFIIIEGLKSTEMNHISNILNYKIALALQAEIILVTRDHENFNSYITETMCFIKHFFDTYENFLGIIINKVNTDIKNNDINFFDYFLNYNKDNRLNIYNKVFKDDNILPILAVIPFNIELMKIKLMDIYLYLNANILYKGKIYTHDIAGYILYDTDFYDIIKNINNNIILIISKDQFNNLENEILYSILKSNIVAILLTGYHKNDDMSKHDCFINTDISIIIVKSNLLETLLKLYNFNFKVKIYSSLKIRTIQQHIIKYFNQNLLSIICSNSNIHKKITSSIFRVNLVRLSKKQKKRIILPEGNDVRILRAASMCAHQGIAHCILLGNFDIIHEIAFKEGIILKKNVTIIDPKDIRKNYVLRLIQLRKHKGLNKNHANELIKDNIVLATLMLEKGDVDGLVAGINHTTAHTIRPALQFIKTKKDTSLVSSIFFMLLSNQVLVYADCAINKEPTSNQLAEIAIQSADSAKLFGLSPRLAMISYSTKNSGNGASVQKVKDATEIVHLKRPDLIIDGPLQYDAATVPYVAMKKNPTSCISGNANILIFPDLNTANTVYKAVQRVTHTIAIGPILQGLKKPINDLSRGAMVEDIIYTIAITAIQSEIR